MRSSAGRQLDALLLGGELRPDLSGAAPPHRRRADRGHPGPGHVAQADRVPAHRQRARAAWSRGSPSPPVIQEMPRREPAEDLLLGGRRQGRHPMLRSRPSATSTAKLADRLREIEPNEADRRQATGPDTALRFGIAFNELRRRLVRPAEAEGETTMIDRLARLADGRARRVLIIAAIFFVVAGVLGSGVADRLDPYGADDPSTESVKADETLRDAGYRDTAVVVLIDGVDPTSPAGRERVAGVADRGRRRPRRRLGDRLRRDRLAGVRLARRRLDLPRGRACGRPTTKRPRTRPSASPARSRASAGSRSGGPRWPRSRSTSRSRRTCARAELLAFPLLFLLSLLFFRSLVAALLPLSSAGWRSSARC